jgi:hypothetical protein
MLDIDVNMLHRQSLIYFFYLLLQIFLEISDLLITSVMLVEAFL